MIQHTRGDENAFDLLQRVMEEDGWNPDIPEDQPRTVRGVYEGRNGPFWAYAKIPADADLLLCYTRCPFDTPAQAIPDAAELVARINYGMRVGNFEIDLDSGLIRFKNSLDFRGVSMTSKLILNVLMPCAFTMDRFLPGLEALIQGGESVQGAIALLGGNF